LSTLEVGQDKLWDIAAITWRSKEFFFSTERTQTSCSFLCGTRARVFAFCFLRAAPSARASQRDGQRWWTRKVAAGSAAHQWRLWTTVLSFLANAIFVVCVCAPHYGALNCALAALLSARRDRHPRAQFNERDLATELECISDCHNTQKGTQTRSPLRNNNAVAFVYPSKLRVSFL